MPKKENTTSYWALKSVSDEEQSYISNDGYADEFERKYVYDNYVPNHKQIKTGDIVAIVNKKEVLGIAKISRIIKCDSTKERRRCPICGNTNYEERKTILPKYRCNQKHEFEEPISETIGVVKYEAFYSDTFILPKNKVTVKDLRPYFHKNYNRNMSMQSLSESFFQDFFQSKLKKLKEEFIYPSAEQSRSYLNSFLDGDYIVSNEDERSRVIQEIFVRRGQQKFRNSLRNLYGDRCMITGCEILHILEAAHINPYKGEKDNHVSNGLLLRSDIHILFDLNLIAIDPQIFKVKVSKSLLSTEYDKFSNRNLLINENTSISINALNIRWKLFNE